jgi:hypothetical protein
MSKSGKGIGNEDIQKALNEWMDKIELQVNSVEEVVYKNVIQKTDRTHGIEARLNEMTNQYG